MNFKYFKTSTLISLILILAVIFQIINNFIELQIGNNEKVKEIVSYIGPISTIGMISIILAIINNYGWKWTMFKFLIDVPNLNGRYTGTLTSSFLDGQGNKIIKDCILEIKQNASYIHICAYYADPGTNSETSNSHSVSEQIVKEPNDLFSLYYIFSNDAATLATVLNNHNGTAHLKYYPDIKTLKGEYYNKRCNTGTIEVRLTSKELLGRLKH